MRKQQELDYRRSRKGLVSTIYQAQRLSSKRRDHNPPEYTRQELESWMFSQNMFNELYSAWVLSGYDTDLKPSIDRVKNSVHYKFENIKITTWKENNNNGYIKRKPWTGSRRSKIIIQLTIDNVIIRLYLSAWYAYKSTLIDQSAIARCCKGKNKSAGGYTWRYK